MKTCPKCDAKNLNSKTVCDECGASIEDIPTIEHSNTISDYTEVINQLKALNEKVSSIETNTINNRSVIISDVNMTFEAIVKFMIKWAVATIPAAIILFVLGWYFAWMISGYLGRLLDVLLK